MEAIAQREQALADAGAPVADQLPETAIPAAASAGLRTIPPREIGGNLDITPARRGLADHAPGARRGSARLGRRPPLRPGRRRGLRHRHRGGGRRHAPLRRPKGAEPPRLPTFETPDRPGRRSFATTGIALDTPMDIDAAARAALLEMIDHLDAQARRADRAAAYALCSVAVDLRISEVVDIPYPLVSALLPLDIFEPS